MPEELERDLFDELLKASGDNIVAQPKKDWNDLTADTSKEEQPADDNNQEGEHIKSKENQE